MTIFVFKQNDLHTYRIRVPRQLVKDVIIVSAAIPVERFQNRTENVESLKILKPLCICLTCVRVVRNTV